MTSRLPATKTMTKAEIAARDLARGYSDADLAEASNNPEWTDEQLRPAKPFVEFFPEIAITNRDRAGSLDAKARKDEPDR